jgi:hypothetical protein
MTPISNLEKPNLESARRSIVVDMSPAAIDRRMRDVCDLWDCWQFLRRFRPVAGDRQESATRERA